MIPRILEVVNDIQHSNGLDEVSDFTMKICHHLGIEYFMVTGLPLENRLLRESIMLSNYPSSWVDHYISEQYLLFDPVAQHCAKTAKPFNWDAVSASPELSKKTKDVMADAASCGLASGLSIPIYTENGLQGCVSLAGSNVCFDEHQKTSLHMLGLYLHDKLCDLDEFEQTRPVLTIREKDVICWAAMGKTNADIGEILSITERTVHFHWANVAAKLGTVNKTHSVVRAILEKIVNL
ncbi:MAG: LuxR family transcriptional regulator [Rhizobiales bacterium]|nr:LuxR family transcriptional regulator [Hyphomicrobiales bacterium]